MRNILKRYLCIVLCFTMCFSVGGYSLAAPVEEEVELSDLIVKWISIVYNEPNYSIKAGGEKLTPKELEGGLIVRPIMRYGDDNVEGMLAPCQDFIRELPGDFQWDGTLDPGKITIELNDDVLVYTLGSVEAELNGETILIPDQELAPVAVPMEGDVFPDGSQYYSIYLPIKFTAEALGAQVMWNAPMRRAEIGFVMYFKEAALDPPTGGSFTTSTMEGGGSIPMSSIRSNPTNAILACFGVAGYQNDDGGWQKTNLGFDTTNNLFLQRIVYHHSTIDNGATIGQTRYLARVLQYLHNESSAVLSTVGAELQSRIPYTLNALDEKGLFDKDDLSGENILAFIEATFFKAMTYLLDAQTLFYAPGGTPGVDDPIKGGWAQYWPHSVGYFKNITFNDNAMNQVVAIMMDILYETNSGSNFWNDFAWTREKIRSLSDGPVTLERIQRAYDLGICYILKAQIYVEGYGLTAWCQQYDPKTDVPARGRAYEHPSIATGESNNLVASVLTRIQPGDTSTDSELFTFDEVAKSIQAWYGWTQVIAQPGLSSVSITDRTRELSPDRVVLPLLLPNGSPNSAPIFGRFYDMKLDENGKFRMIFSGRDSVIVYDHNQVQEERRISYSFTNTNTASNATTTYTPWAAPGGNGYAWLVENGYITP